jgi:hypothetical protein
MGLYGTASAACWRTPSRLRPNSGVRPPLWVSCWTKGATGSTGVVQGMAAFASSTGAACMGAYIDGGGSTWIWDENDAAGYQQVYGTGALPNVWQHIFCNYPSLSNRQIWFDGVRLGTDLNALATPQTLDTFIIGAVSPLQTYLGTNRMVAEAVFGQGELSPLQIQQLAQRANPLAVCPSQILAYFPLRGDLSDSGPMRTGLMRLGNPATIWGEHPPVALPPRRRLLRSGGVVVPPPTARPFIRMVA